LPSRINWAVPVGTGVTGATVATTVRGVPWVAVEGFTVMVVVLGRVPAVTVNEEAAETDD
jgi:hypothetical protein